MVSVREGGSSVAEISKSVISKRARVVFLIFVWLALCIVITVFASICADTFISEPKIVISSLGLIPLAIVVGFFIYRLKQPLWLSTALGIAGIVFLVLLGQKFPFSLQAQNPKNLWLLVLFIYAFFASIIPVNILLQPRDYLASFLLFAALILGGLGIIIVRPKMVAPAFISFDSSQGYAFPMLCVVIACGAISGFHSLVASGTTSKQLPREPAAKKIGYGGMLLEGVLAVIALITVGVAFSQDKPIEVFSRGFSQITSLFLGKHGKFLATVILNAFILTTLDTATRINRYITEELVGVRNRFITTFLVLAFSGYLAFSGGWNTLWKMFGISNQLVGALALIAITLWLINKGKNSLFLLIPALFMLVVTLTALSLSLIRFIGEKNVVLVAVSSVLFILGIFVTIEAVVSIRKKRRAKI